MDEQQAIARYRQFNAAMAANDVAQLTEILAPEFTLTHMSGFVQSRDEWLDEIERGQMYYDESREVQVAASPIAVGWQVRGHNVVSAAIHGGRTRHWRLNTVMPINQHGVILKAVVTPY
ncbi:nuclear transport factor 2 family protein [Lactiplantibacillus carotarum]|uniref:nuclear transport factor 2 family protein n=1 Tax=Lactiplantibacillus carotarum TaxID=2993456 RepID=UPI00298F000A|nr:nuclear transport factor 2 family protein [Lactiplantibacillus carotarum]